MKKPKRAKIAKSQLGKSKNQNEAKMGPNPWRRAKAKKETKTMRKSQNKMRLRL